MLTTEHARRLFEVPERRRPAAQDGVSAEVVEGGRKRVESLLADISARQGTGFDEEMDKLDRWAEDKRTGLKANLREHDGNLKLLNATPAKPPTFPRSQRFKKIKQVEAAREDAWRAYDAEAREVEAAKEGLIDDVESRLPVRQTVDRVLAVRFTVI